MPSALQTEEGWQTEVWKLDTSYYREIITRLSTYFWLQCLAHFLTLSWPAGHICSTYTESFQVRWDNSIPLFLHAAIYLEVSLFRWTSQNAFSRETAMYKWYSVQCCYAALHTVSFVHGCFAGKCILTGSTEQRYFKLDGSMEKKWDTVIPADLKRRFVSGTYMSRWSRKG